MPAPPPRTIEELLSRHFRQRAARTGLLAHLTEEPGETIGPGEAATLCAHLTPRQRAAIDPGSIAALSDVLDELVRTREENKYRSDAKPISHSPPPWCGQDSRLEAFDWFKARRGAGLGQSWVTLAVAYGLTNRGDLGSRYVGRNWQLRWCVRDASDVVGKRKLKLDAEQAFAAIEP